MDVSSYWCADALYQPCRLAVDGLNYRVCIFTIIECLTAFPMGETNDASGLSDDCF